MTGHRVRVKTALGVEVGVVVGVAHPVAKGERGTVTVKFADGTRSTWQETLVSCAECCLPLNWDGDCDECLDDAHEAEILARPADSLEDEAARRRMMLNRLLEAERNADLIDIVTGERLGRRGDRA